MAKSKRQKPQQPLIVEEPKPKDAEIPKEDEELLGTPSKEKELLGYHPVTGEEVWK
jgi:hypothetical protein